LPLHLGDGGVRCVDVHQRIVSLAILLDLVRDRSQTPIFGLADRAAIVGQDRLELVRQGLDLLGRDILARQKHMLIEWHEVVPFRAIVLDPGAKPLLNPDTYSSERLSRNTKRAGTPEAGSSILPDRRIRRRPSVQPPTGVSLEWRAYRPRRPVIQAISTRRGAG